MKSAPSTPSAMATSVPSSIPTTTNFKPLPLADYEIVESIDLINMDNGGYRLLINGREVPFYLPEDYVPVLITDGEGLARFELTLIAQPETQMRQYRYVEPHS